MAEQTQRDRIFELVVQLCEKQELRTFELTDFYSEFLPLLEKEWPENRNVKGKIRQQLQELRDDKKLTFVDGKGRYTLSNVPNLMGEIEPEHFNAIQHLPVEKREYLIETYARKARWTKMAHERFGRYCLCRNCRNTFLREDNTPYIEVHHIIPLCDGGEDHIENLSVLCAHHHRFAHYAQYDERMRFREQLMKQVHSLL